MTAADRLRSALDRLHWGGQSLATILGVNERTVRRWCAGQNDAPQAVLDWLDRLAAFVDANPAPTKSKPPDR